MGKAILITAFVALLAVPALGQGLEFSQIEIECTAQTDWLMEPHGNNDWYIHPGNGTCENWLEFSQSPEASAQATWWATGMLSASSILDCAPVNWLQDIDNATIRRGLTNFCTANPQASMFAGILALRREFIERSLQ